VYTVLFPSGRIEVFGVKALADTYVIAYRGVLLSAPTIPTEIEGYSEIPVGFNCEQLYNNSIVIRKVSKL
jgi:hypothetical protein